MQKGKNIVNGAKFSGRSFFRPTAMSAALSEAGAIPAPHLVKELATTARLRHKNDNFNQRPSAYVVF